jgi:hypothetical protein
MCRPRRRLRLIIDLERVRRCVNAAIDELVVDRGPFLAVSDDFYWQSLPSLDENHLGDVTFVASLVDDYDDGCGMVEQYPEDLGDLWPHVLHSLGSLLSVLKDFTPKRATAEDVAASGQTT